MFSRTHRTLYEHYVLVNFDRIKDTAGTIDAHTQMALRRLGIHDISVAVFQPLSRFRKDYSLELFFNGFTVQHPDAKKYDIRSQAIATAKKLVDSIQQGAYYLLNPKEGHMKLRLIHSH